MLCITTVQINETRLIKCDGVSYATEMHKFDYVPLLCQALDANVCLFIYITQGSMYTQQP